MMVILITLTNIMAALLHPAGIVSKYGYIGLFSLMLGEAASLPIPSEVVLPIAGLLSAKGLFNFYIAFAIVIVAEIIGMTIDYYIAYFVGKEVMYKHTSLFLKKDRIIAFDNWFNENGKVALFASRLIPIVRGLISFPAGFSKMPKKTFYFYSITGSLIWNAFLMSFGYYALNVSSIYLTLVLLGILIVVLYAAYLIVIKKIRKK